jgi:nitrite reductase/ring-hydroxylating ferredoxin subunit
MRSDTTDSASRTATTCDHGVSRRVFLDTTAGGCALAILAALGLDSNDALALPILLTSGQQNGNELRYPIPASDSVNVDHAAQVIVVRAQGHVFVFNLSCPHQNAAVKWLPADNRFQCTKHNSRYKPDGVYIDGRATRNMDRFVVRHDDGFVVAELNHMIQSDKDPAGWAAAAITV